ncbi:hypothetical protein [Homoserinibacter sp. GY 40078]|uniref:hypothetical protein n=1 Tax=Homoserinibacter sp. GY 40078 TaxID=2603275 RepID=UPI0011CB48C0|nr:hypothetical protein [Homoserinibacter sp. GY 40078]TXK17712.1 hypothetical protein FVQ89_12995 [Homoserinibacter sp. GY 40078]
MRLLRPDSRWIGEDEIDDAELVIGMTRDDLLLFGGGLLETLEAVEDWEFHTRLGFTPADARALLSNVAELLRETYQPET